MSHFEKFIPLALLKFTILGDISDLGIMCYMLNS